MKNPQLKSVPERLRIEFLHGYIKIQYESNAAYRVNATYTPGSHEISGFLHVTEEFWYGKRTGDIV